MGVTCQTVGFSVRGTCGKAEMVRRPGHLPFEVMHSVRWQPASVEHGHGTDRLSDAKSRKSAAYFFVRYSLLK